MSQDAKQKLGSEISRVFYFVTSNCSFGLQIISPEYRYIYLNEVLLNQIKMVKEELVGKKMSDVFPGIEKAQVYSEIEACFATKEPRSFVNEFTLESGETLYYNLDLEYFDDCVVITSRNITEAKSLEVLLEKTNQRLEESVEKRTQELGAKNILLAAERDRATAAEKASKLFLANMSHEIRTPMNGIIGVADLIRDNLGNRKLASKWLDVLVRSGENLLRIIDDILSYSKLHSTAIEVEKKPFSLFELYEEQLTLLNSLAGDKSGLEVSSNFECHSEIVEGDKFRLGQVLTNLIGNAVKFTSSGFIEFDFKEVVNSDTSALHIKVADSGIGMNHDQLARIFMPFSQADDSVTRRFGGTGLGLAISKELIEAMKGTIKVESTPGKGTNFELSFPLVKTSKVSKKLSNNKREIYDLDLGLRILLVEDNLLNQEIATFILRSIGYDPMVAATGIECLDLMKENCFDVIFMDYHMPEMDGIEATRAIRSNKDLVVQPKIIALTASAMESEREACFAAGMDDFLAKPLRRSELTKILGRIEPRKAVV
ncbi:ATP-binding protein [Pseudobacteriovorax antillogorgiicola]|uniref:histidine kinase n=1 Tax=Pseudobacteriovorax antillogorgiicola TaxID=1513793 RepID=A0A1Y6BHX1_9BACT|nr:ATP-binding protein [Pseudobacteriovorax antillogorgiicola]TCS55470.1 signal transduction histidine kinase [Pseudobacteriovorax antillogorgiicola]SMF12082.1 Signal transduction histidine kinase [Pseudobacteriovorax antillogorgiicola]